MNLCCNNQRNHPPFSTCCGTIHVHNALLGIIIIMLFFEVVETIQYLASETYAVDSFSEFFFEAVESLVLICTMASWWGKSAKWLIPFIVNNMVAVIVMCLTTILLIFCTLFPSSHVADQFSPFTVPAEARRLVFLWMIFVFVTFTFLVWWFLKVGFCAYQYYQHLEIEDFRRRSRPLPSLLAEERMGSGPKTMALVIPSEEGEGPSSRPSMLPISATGNFSNPNYSDDEEELFAGRNNASMV